MPKGLAKPRGIIQIYLVRKKLDTSTELIWAMDEVFGNTVERGAAKDGNRTSISYEVRDHRKLSAYSEKISKVLRRHKVPQSTRLFTYLTSDRLNIRLSPKLVGADQIQKCIDAPFSWTKAHLRLQVDGQDLDPTLLVETINLALSGNGQITRSLPRKDCLNFFVEVGDCVYTIELIPKLSERLKKRNEIKAAFALVEFRTANHRIAL